MCDMFLFFGTIFIIATFVAIGHYIERQGACKHEFSSWDLSETEHAYVQIRFCTKCGTREVTQFRKVTGSKE